MTLRHSYYDSLWTEIADTTESDRKELEARILLVYDRIQKTTDASNKDEIISNFIRLPTIMAMERFALLEDRMKREFLSKETKNSLVRRIEMRRFYATHMFVEHMLGFTVLTNDIITGLLHALTESFYQDSIGHGYSKEESNENAVTQTIFHYCISLYSKNGKPTFVPSPGLTDALVHTEFRDVPNEWVKLPHPAIFIEAPRGSGLHIMNVESGLHDLSGAFVVDMPPDDTQHRKFRILLVGKTKPNNGGPNIALFNDALSHFCIQLKTGGTVGSSLREMMSEIQKQCLDGLRDSKAIDRWRTEGLEDCIRFILNTILYVTLPDAEIKTVFADSDIPHLTEKLERSPKGSQKRKGINDQLKKLSRNKVTYLGSSVKIDRLSGDSNGQSTGSDRKINVAFIRRGHWRNQPYGQGRQQTKLLWIRPTMVNPSGPMKITTYSVE